jgi:DNA-binding NarL/FixJ family response regulator
VTTAPTATRQGRDQPVRVACVDDDTLIREGAARLLTGVDVVAVFPSVEELLQRPRAVDVVLLDLWLQGGSDVPTLTPIMQGAPGVRAIDQAGYRVLIYTNERRRLVLAGCLAAGARGVVHKSEPLASVEAAAIAVASDRIVITPALTGLAEVVQRRGELPSLSPRQLEVLRGRARGETYKSISTRLFISPKTAEEYMGEVTKRFSEYLHDHSAADLERLLGVGSGDLLAEG